MKEGITYEIICRKRLNRIECPFKKQDPELVCAQCSFAGFIERQKQEKQNEQQQSDIQ
jgi:hypothetical protein